MTDSTTIKIKFKTHERLRKHGTMGDSMDSVINKVLDLLEKRK